MNDGEFSPLNRNRKARFGWAMYDWANSVYSLVITTAIFPPYFHAMSKAVATRVEHGPAGDVAMVNFLGMELTSVTFFSISFAIAYSIIALVTPLLSAIADYSGIRKKMMMVFCSIGSLSCSLLYFFTPDTYYLGFWLFIIGAVGFAGGLIFNDAFLPEVSAPEDYDRTSAFGYSLGYIGSVVLMVFNLSMILFQDFYFDVPGKVAELTALHPGKTAEEISGMIFDHFFFVASRISFLTVGIWWFLFAQLTFFLVKESKPPYKPKNYILEGFRELRSVLRNLSGMASLKRYLLAYFFFNMALQTVMLMASSYGSEELKLNMLDLTVTLLAIQLIAIPGALLFAWSSRKIGNFRTLLIGIFIWIAVCFGAFFFVSGPVGYKILGAVVGLIMGGMQSLARATYSKLLPPTRDTASFFSFYQITDKIAIIIGTFSFGLIAQFIGMRWSILLLTVFFVAGGLLIWSLIRKKVLEV